MESPTKKLVIDEEFLLQSCLGNKSINELLEEPSIQIPVESLKRKHPSNEKPNQKEKRIKKRVSFGDNTEILISPPESSKKLKVKHEEFQHDISEIYSKVEENETISEEIDLINQSRYGIFKKNYEMTLKKLKESLGLYPNAPDDSEINILKERNQELEQEIAILNAKISKLEQERVNEEIRDEKEVSNLYEELNESRCEYQKSVGDKQAVLDRLVSLHSLYKELLMLAVEEEYRNLYSCRVQNLNFEFKIEQNGRCFKYDPKVSNTLNDTFLACKIQDLTKHELSMLYSRILKFYSEQLSSN